MNNHIIAYFVYYIYLQVKSIPDQCKSKQIIYLSHIAYFVYYIYLQVKLIPDQCNSKGELINHDSINIRPWSLTLGTTQDLECTIVRCAWTVTFLL